MKPQTLKFVFEKETKTTFRYKEEVEEGKKPVVGTLYIDKTVTTAEPPKEVIVTITPTNA